MIDVIGFDADDTLWENEVLYQNAQKAFQALLAPWANQEAIQKKVYNLEMRNLPLYGYGIKAFCLSLIEAALDLSDAQMPATIIRQILDIGRGMLQAEVQLHAHVQDTLEKLHQHYRLMVITKGDLLDQTAKLSRSGLETYFETIEVLNHKTQTEYAALLTSHKITPENFMMVGNSLRADVLPVLALGGKAVHVPAKTTWAHEMVEDFDKNTAGFSEIEHLGKLPELIKEKFSGGTSHNT